MISFVWVRNSRFEQKTDKIHVNNVSLLQVPKQSYRIQSCMHSTIKKDVF